MEKWNGFIDVISVLKFHISLSLDADFPGPQSFLSASYSAALSQIHQRLKTNSEH